MKTLKKLACLTLLLSFHSNFAQTKVDSLLQDISNKDAYIVLARTLSPRINGDSAHEIVTIGQTATPELVKILEHQNKGIIAHFILLEIWKDHWEEEICCNIRNAGNAEIVIINGLEIRIENDELSATPDALKKNKVAWKDFLHA